ERLPQPNDIANHDAAALVEVASGEFDSSLLIFEKHAVEIPGKAELRQPHPRVIGEMVSDLKVYVVRGDRFRASPALLDYLHEVVGDVNAPPVGPALLEPVGELSTGIVVDDVDV